MASSTIGSLIVSVETNLAQFTGDMGRMAAVAESHMRSIDRAVANTKKNIEQIVSIVSIGAMARYAISLVETAAHLQDLHLQTGLSVEALSAMRTVAARTGQDVDSVAVAFDRLQKNVFLAQKGTGDAAVLLSNLGFKAKDLAEGLKEPDKMLLEVARAMDQYADDGNKASYMQVLFGRSGPQMISFLHEVAQEGYAAANATGAMALKAHEMEQRWVTLKESVKAGATETLMAWLPSIEKIVAGLRYLGVWLVADVTEGLAQFKYAALIAWYEVIDKMQEYGNSFANWWRRVMSNMGYHMDEVPFENTEAAKNLAKLRTELNDIIVLNEKVKRSAQFDWYLATHLPPPPPPGPAKPSLPGIVPFKSDVTSLRRDLDAQIKALNDTAKKIEESWKTHDAILDREYRQGEMSLSDYGDTKIALMESNAVAVQAVYDKEILIIQDYIARMAVEQRRAEAAKAPLATIDKITNQISEAQAKLDTAQTARAGATNNALKAQEAIIKDLTTASSAYADVLVNVDEQYFAMTSDTEALARIQTEWNDRTQRAILIANQDWEALEKLKKVEDDLILRGKRDWFSGVRVAVHDWSVEANNMAKQTGALVTDFLNNMTDALVQFVQTGKLNFHNLINSMIADLARLIIQQQIAGWATQLVGAFAGAGSGSVNTSGISETSGGWVGPRAAGGSVFSGSPYLVGEQGPEVFTPATSGVITPNGGGAGGGVALNYAPIFHIDSRSDRGQVHADMTRLVQKGNRDMLALLQRHNPGLKA